MELKRCHKVEIQNPCHRPPNYLYHTNDTEVVVPLWDQYGGLPGALLCEVTLAKGCLNQSDDHQPFGGVRQFLQNCGPLIVPKILHPHARQSARPVESQVSDRPGHLLLLRH